MRRRYSMNGENEKCILNTVIKPKGEKPYARTRHRLTKLQ